MAYGDGRTGRFFWLRWTVLIAIAVVVLPVALLMVVVVASNPLSVMPPAVIIAGGAGGLALVTGCFGIVRSILARSRRDHAGAWFWVRIVLLADLLLLMASSPIIVDTLTRPVEF